ncbi:MAG: hypothetical protein CMD23_03160 [Flavobacteriales bacterium]|nr:hypothetical protein [Flavobacteriales bacterium]|tara:strand:+ start:403 stop:1521 length:1119 start_codon:yes stop_codon:yes gene_type:complete
MKNQILLFVVLFLTTDVLFSQENRSNRGWNDSNQTTYYMGEKDNSNNEFRSTPHPQSNVNNPDNDAWNDNLTHRSKAIWSDNSTIVSDEKTGHHRMIPYTYVSEDDVLWAKRVKKILDIRISQNHPLYFPVAVGYDSYMKNGVTTLVNEVLSGMDARKNLYQILKDAATTINPETGQPLVSVFNSSLTRQYTTDEVVGNRSNNQPGLFQFVQTVETFDEFGDVIDENDVLTEYRAVDIVGYYIDEEIFFDKRKSKLDYRYISITPLVLAQNAQSMYTGSDRTVKELGTFYFPEIRQLLANHKVFPLDGNIAQRMSFDEFFHRKLFASSIIKESNVYDRQINNYLPGRTLEQLLEGERIREQIRRYESDMWNY